MKHQTTAYWGPLHSQARACKVQKKIQQHRKRGTRHTAWTQKVMPLPLCKRGEYNYRSQTTSSNIQKDVATLLQRLHQILLRIHEYRVRIIYKPGLDLFRVDWLSRQNHKENKDREIPGMKVNIDTIQTTNKHPILHDNTWDEHLQQLKEHIIKGWPQNKDQIPQEIRMYWTFWNDMAVTDRVILKGRHIAICNTLQNRH